MPRSAVKVTKAPGVYLEELQKRAVDLEKQLAASAKETDKANQLRIPLCEVLADMLLTDPAYAMDKDVIGRLWRHCFYSRIGPQRARIAKDKRKQLDTSKQEKALVFFLVEAVTLYDYLADKLKSKLTGVPSSQETASQETSTIATAESIKSTKGVVACLQRIYIHLGDLYRYSNNLHKAERAYEMASKLGPGHGHAYNQLAVVCQVKDQQGAPLSAVALYWYARSLLATTEIFETSKANLTRLFASNRDWLGNQVDLKMDSKSPKAVQSRRFLAQFVDLHYHFFKGLHAHDIWIYESISKIMDTFRQLLNNSALGDSLLCKMVAIHAFSEGFTGREILNSDATVDRSILLQTTTLAARVATYKLGTHLADRILQGMQKLNGKLPPSVRLLLPLLLVAEYCSSRPVTSQGVSVEHTEAYDQALVDFWKKMVEVWNHLHRLVDGMEQDGVDLDALKEYHYLRGYAPFAPFLQEMETGYLSDEEAIPLLQATTATTQPSQESSALSVQSSASTTASPDQGRIKVARFIKLGERLTEDEESDLGKCFRLVDDELVWVDDEPMVEDTAAPMDETPEKTDDLLVYQQAAAGGPALLVPGALLNSSTEPNLDMETENAGDKFPARSEPAPAAAYAPVAPLQAMPDNAIVPTLPMEPTKPPVAPPPGFAAPVAAPPTAGTVPPATLPPPGFHGNAPPPLGLDDGCVPTLGESLHLFYPPGALKTSNPFADANITNPPNGNASSFFGGYPSFPRDDSFLDHNDMEMDAPSLLDSSLLDTLMGGKPKTKNPFLT